MNKAWPRGGNRGQNSHRPAQAELLGLSILLWIPTLVDLITSSSAKWPTEQTGWLQRKGPRSQEERFHLSALCCLPYTLAGQCNSQSVWRRMLKTKRKISLGLWVRQNSIYPIAWKHYSSRLGGLPSDKKFCFSSDLSEVNVLNGRFQYSTLWKG